jgi:hypothetical protein
MPKRSLMLLLATLLTTPANAVTVTIGYWDEGVQGFNNPIVNIGTWGTAPFTLNNFQFGNFGGVLSVVSGPEYYELAVNNVHDSYVSDTIRIYATWTDVTTPFNQLVLPSIFQVSHAQPGFIIVEQIYLCSNGQLFCDNYRNPVGQLIGDQWFDPQVEANYFPTLTGVAPSLSYSITEVIHIAANIGAVSGDVAAAIVVDPVAPVPGPVAGAGLPGLILASGGLLGWWRRRQKIA